MSRIPEDLAADHVVVELRERRVHAAVVADAAGRTVGLITMQDVLGELLNPRSAPAGNPTPASGEVL